MSILRVVPFAIALILPLGASCQSPIGPGVGAVPQAPYEALKTLAGNWQGAITTDSPAWATDKPIPLSIRLASHGNALIHELNTGGPEVTVLYMDGNRLSMTHYCDFGNRPHMVAQPAPDSKVIHFTLVEAPGSNEAGHVSEGTFTVIDPNHHLEDWVFLPKEGKPVHAHIDFKRIE